MCSKELSFPQICFQIFPVCYVLMTSKSRECYAAVFKYIEEHVYEMQPDEIITDFEDGLRAAIKQQWADVILRGCWYHYCVCICQHLIKLGLGPLLKRNADARRVKNMVLCLPLLPSELFDQGLEYIKNLAAKKRLSKRFSAFFAYFNYWVQQVKILFTLPFVVKL